MRRAPSLIAKSVLLLTGLAIAGSVSAAGNARSADASKRASNSFNLFVTPAPPGSAVAVEGPGSGIASSKTVITNPYNVPLIQNAGSLYPGR